MKVVEAWPSVNLPTFSGYKKEYPHCVNPNLGIGIELEIENCERIGTTVSTALIQRSNFSITTDNSLRGNAYEFVSQPMASKHAIGALTDFFEATKFDDSNYSDRCSVHIHANCLEMELEEVSAVCLLYQVMEEIMFEFVGRERDSNIYCIPWNQCRNHYELINRFLKDPRNTLRGWNKYIALNLLPLASYGTIEFRHMHGTADINKLTTWINLIGGLFKYAKEHKLKDLITQLKELNTTSHYERFFNKVVCGQLPYNEVYRSKLEEGVILAKFGLIVPSKRAPVAVDPEIGILNGIPTILPGALPVRRMATVNLDERLHNLQRELTNTRHGDVGQQVLNRPRADWELPRVYERNIPQAPDMFQIEDDL